MGVPLPPGTADEPEDRRDEGDDHGQLDEEEDDAGDGMEHHEGNNHPDDAHSDHGGAVTHRQRLLAFTTTYLFTHGANATFRHDP